MASVVLSLVAGAMSAVSSPQPAGAGTSSTCDAAPKPGSLPFLLPPWNDASGWSQPAQFETIQSADVDGNGRSELVGRNGGALEVYSWAPPLRAGDPEPGQWMTEAAGPALVWNEGWLDESQYSTIQFADIDGDGADELVARASGGIVAWKLVGGAWVQLPDGPGWSDGDGWGDAFRYDTIQTGDFDGNGSADLIGMNRNGSDYELLAYTYVPSSATTGTWQQLTTLNLGTGGWDRAEYYSTIQAGDLDGDGAAELVIRSSDGIWLRKLVGGAWVDLPNGPAWTNDEGFGEAYQYETIQTGDVDGDRRADLLGMRRNGSDDELLAYTYVPASATTGTWQQLPTLNLGTGWDLVEYYSTIQTGDVAAGGGAEVLARSSAGLEVFTLTGGTWSPGPTLNAVSDANKWNASDRYPTVHAVPTATGQPEVVIGRESAGIETWRIAGGMWADTSAAFPSWVQEAIDPTDPLQRAYRYINNQVGAEYWADDKLPDGNAVPVLAKFPDLTQALGGVQGYIQNLKPRGLNITRADWDLVKGEMFDWVTGVIDVRRFFGVGGSGPPSVLSLAQEKLVLTSDVLTAVYGSYFGGNPEILAILSDLLWGVIAGLGAFAAPEVLAAATFAASISGAGVAAVIDAVNDGNDEIKKKYDELLIDLTNYFCGSVFAIDEGYAHIVADYGLLTTATQLVGNQTWEWTPPSYNNTLAAMDQAQNVWSFQQLAAESWRAGYCSPNFLGDYICTFSDDNDNVYTVPDIATVVNWRGIGGTDCLDHHNEAWDHLRKDLGVQLADVFAPLDSDGKAVTDPVGTGGWRLKVHSCNG